MSDTPTHAPNRSATPAPFDWQKLLHVLVYALAAFLTARYGIQPTQNNVTVPPAKVDVTVPPPFGGPAGTPGDTPRFRAVELVDRDGTTRLILTAEDGAGAKVFAAGGKLVGAVEFEKLLQRRRLFGEESP